MSALSHKGIVRSSPLTVPASGRSDYSVEAVWHPAGKFFVVPGKDTGKCPFSTSTCVRVCP